VKQQQGERAWEQKYRDIWSWDRTARVTHPQDCYPGNCSFVAYIRDGKIVREEQTGRYPVVDPSTPDWNPRGCNKGCMYSAVTYGKERVLQPMKQMGARGSGEWKPISWEEAYREIADALVDEMIENPQSIVLETPAQGGSFQARAPIVQLINALGGCALDAVGEFSDISIGQYMTFGKYHHAGTQDTLFKAGLNLVWHMNPVYTRIPGYHFLSENKYKGGELVVIAPDYSPSCVHADQYVPIRAGTDAALALGMCRVILEKGLEDREFIKTQTDLPLLVRDDTSRFLRESDIEDGASDEIFYIWDTHGSLVKAPQDTLDLGALEPDLDAGHDVNLKDGTRVGVKTVFALLVESLRDDFPPEKVQEITGLHPDVVEELAKKVATRPTNILAGLNTPKVFHGDLIERSMCLLLALTGNWGRPGSGIGSWGVIPDPGVPFGGGGGSSEGLARRIINKANPTAEELSIRSNMIQAKLYSPTVPPFFFWYYHCGYKKVWDAMPAEEMGLPRKVSDYVDEALRAGWWEGFVRPGPSVEPRVLFVMGNNPLRRLRGGTRTLLKELWPKLRKVITVDFRWSTTALYSDIVLPAAFFYEKEQFHTLTSSEVRFWAYGQKAIDPVGDSRSEWKIANGLARTIAQRASERGLDEYRVPHGVTPERCKAVLGRALSIPDALRPILGVLRRFNEIPDLLTMNGKYSEDDVEEALKDMVERCKDAGIFEGEESLEKIRERGFVKYNGLGTTAQARNIATEVHPDSAVTSLLLHTRDHVPYPTITGRAQFYIDHPWFLESGEALPTHKAPPRQGGNYSFRMDGGHLRWSIHASTATNELMAQTHRGEPFIFVNEMDAQHKGVADGDRIRVFNDFGDFIVQAKLSALPARGQLIMYHAWDPHQYTGWRSYDHIIPGQIKPLHLAGGYGHLNYWVSNWQPQQVDRHISVDFEKVK
jgi:DMSO reductase family type II enzyme molybdopterin subunit